MQLRSAALAVAFTATLATAITAAVPAAAQQAPYGYRNAPPAWERYEDRRHAIVGTITHFEPFRLQLARPDGTVQTIDLKNGTVIRPTGTTPMVGERVEILGYYSNGTFIANRVNIHP